MLRLKLRHSWIPFWPIYTGEGELCDTGGDNKWPIKLYNGSFNDPSQFVTSIEADSPVGGNVTGHYSKTEFVIGRVLIISST